ncbi:hypothetical protein D3C72_1845680 [compost metagenome]
MSATTDQAGAGVEKLVGFPVQGDATVGAAVVVQVHATRAAHGKHGDAFDGETTTVAFGQFGGQTEKMHNEGLPEVTVSA